jgi:hypothetical protein
VEKNYRTNIEVSALYQIIDITIMKTVIIHLKQGYPQSLTRSESKNNNLIK